MRKKRQLLQLQIDAPPVVMDERGLQPEWGGARRGAGRKKGTRTTATVSVRMSTSLKAILEKRAMDCGQTVSGYLVQLIMDVEFGADEF